MKKFFLSIFIVGALPFIVVVFIPNSKVGLMIDKLLFATNKKISFWEKEALEGNLTAISNLIYYSSDKKEKEKWLKLYKELRNKQYKKSKATHNASDSNVSKVILNPKF